MGGVCSVEGCERKALHEFCTRHECTVQRCNAQMNSENRWCKCGDSECDTLHKLPEGTALCDKHSQVKICAECGCKNFLTGSSAGRPPSPAGAEPRTGSKSRCKKHCCEVADCMEKGQPERVDIFGGRPYRLCEEHEGNKDKLCMPLKCIVCCKKMAQPGHRACSRTCSRKLCQNKSCTKRVSSGKYCAECGNVQDQAVVANSDVEI